MQLWLELKQPVKKGSFSYRSEEIQANIQQDVIKGHKIRTAISIYPEKNLYGWYIWTLSTAE